MSDLIWLSEAQMRRIEPYFPLSHGVPRVDDRRIISGIIFVIRVTDRLLPRCLLRLEAVGELGIVDEVIKELVPGVGGETRLAEHVRQLIDAVIG